MTKWVRRCRWFWNETSLPLSMPVKHGFSLDQCWISYRLITTFVTINILFLTPWWIDFHLESFRDKLFTRKDYGQFELGFSGLTRASSRIWRLSQLFLRRYAKYAVIFSSQIPRGLINKSVFACCVWSSRFLLCGGLKTLRNGLRIVVLLFRRDFLMDSIGAGATLTASQAIIITTFDASW